MMKCDIVVDGGGSATRLGLVINGAIVVRHECATCNAVSAQVSSGAQLLTTMLEELWQLRPQGVTEIESMVLALSNVSTPSALECFAEDVCDVWMTADPFRAARIWLVNDIVPLVVGSGVQAVAIAGTGTGFAAMSAKGKWARASGLEYLLSDEGGGFDIGQQGLRAVVRAFDGRGPWTQLIGRAKLWGADSVEDLASFVYGHTQPKVLIASFAQEVLCAAAEGDTVSISIVHASAHEILTGIRAVCRRTEITGSVQCGYSGSLLTGQSDVLRLELSRLVQSEEPDFQLVPLSTDTLQPMLGLMNTLQTNTSLLQEVPLATELVIKQLP